MEGEDEDSAAEAEADGGSKAGIGDEGNSDDVSSMI